MCDVQLWTQSDAAAAAAAAFSEIYLSTRCAEFLPMLSVALAVRHCRACRFF